VIYSLAVAAPKNTTKASPVEETLVVHPGVVKQLDILIPDRCAGLLHVVILRNLQQIWPPYEDDDFTGDDTHWSFPEEYHVADAPFVFTVRAWNDDDTYPHTAYVAMAILPRDSAAGGGLLMDFIALFQRLMQGKV